ncbi:MAG: fumarylacetoacetate hydrolase family protein [Planctomycetaceae bacterium]|nr:fumarylacetoacetate hydrolase family protein [Planctomycetaceae bacterium]
MRIVRFSIDGGKTIYGKDLGDGSAEVIHTSPLREPPRTTGQTTRIGQRKAPIEPVNLFCIGKNYLEHAKEGGDDTPPERPIMFMKPTSALNDPDSPIRLPDCSPRPEVDFEGELAVVIGKRCLNVTPDEALDYVFGYTCANDVSARDWQKDGGGGQWCRGKTFATFCPLGPCMVTADEIPDPNTLGIRTILNGNVMQDWNTNDMIFDVPTLIEFLSGSTILAPGTVILTGTPHGVGMARNPPVLLKHGDEITIEIDGIGRLTNPVIDETV